MDALSYVTDIFFMYINSNSNSIQQNSRSKNSRVVQSIIHSLSFVSINTANFAKRLRTTQRQQTAAF